MIVTKQDIRQIDLNALILEDIGESYFRSLANPQTKQDHVLLHGVTPALPVRVIENDFATWYAGFRSLARMLNATVNLPPTEDMIAFVSSNFDRALAAIAA